MDKDTQTLILVALGAVALVGVAYLVFRHMPAQGQSQLQLQEYTNAEEWEIVRGQDGRIVAVTIHREARSG